jgi:hypothetical protein
VPLRIVAAVLVAALAIAACSGGGSKKGATHDPACKLIASLDSIAATVAHTDVADPGVFQQALNTGVTQYLATLRSLKPMVPLNVQASLDRVAGDMQQHQFQAANTDRAALDQYAAQKCGRTAATTSTTAG